MNDAERCKELEQAIRRLKAQVEAADKAAELARLQLVDTRGIVHQVCDAIWEGIYPGRTDWEYPTQVIRHFRDKMESLRSIATRPSGFTPEDVNPDVKRLVDELPLIELARVHRFGVVGHLFFMAQNYPYFQQRFTELGGWTPELSNEIGWDRP